MQKRLARPILESARQEHERPLTQTIRVSGQAEVPAGFLRVPVKSLAIFAKVQVLSSKLGQPIFVETDGENPGRRIAYWVHPGIVSELAAWLSYREFPLHDLIDDADAEQAKAYSSPNTSYMEYKPGP